MKRLLFLILFWPLLAVSQQTNKTPINRGMLQTDLDGNGKSGTNFGTLRSTNFIDAVTGLPITGGGSSVDTNLFVGTNSMPWVRVMADGTAYGPTGTINTASSLTRGINEAVHSLFQTNAVGIAVGGGVLIIAPGVYDLATNITIPDQFNFQLQIRGSGKGTTTLINSSATNMFCLEKTTPGDIGNGGSKPFSCSFSDLTLAQRYDTNKQAIVFLDGKLNQGVIENCAFAALQCLAFTNKISSNPVGQGGGLLFISGTPTNAVGTVGIWINGGFDNKTVIRKCDFYGLAAGIFDGQDHTAISDIMGTACGRWYDIGTITPHNGTAWTPIGTFGNHSQGNNNLLSVGGVVIANDPIYDFTMDRCYFFESVCGLLNVGVNAGANIRMLNPFWETCAYQVLFSRTENDEHLGAVSIMEQGDSGANATISTYGYVSLTNGAITLSNPLTEAQLMRIKLGPNQFKISDVRSRQLFFLNGDTSLGSPASGNISWLGTNYGNGNGLTNVNATNLTGNAATSLKAFGATNIYDGGQFVSSVFTMSRLNGGNVAQIAGNAFIMQMNDTNGAGGRLTIQNGDVYAQNFVGTAFTGSGAGLTGIPPGGITMAGAGLVGRSSAGVAQQITVGSGLSLTGTTLTATGGSGGSNETWTALSIASNAINPTGTNTTGAIGPVKYKCTLTGNITVNNPNGTLTDGQQMIFQFLQDGTGSRTITWGSAFAFGTDITGTTTSGASLTDYATCVYDSTSTKWRVVGWVRGY